MTILKKEFPTMKSVHARDNFLKLPVSSEEEHYRLKRKLQELKAEFKGFNLKQDRPVKIVIRGLPVYTNHEPIIEAMKFKGFNVVKFTQLTKSQSRVPMTPFKSLMLQKDRPIKVVLRGLPGHTPIEDDLSFPSLLEDCRSMPHS
ncbi:hypothetical protein CEXT_275661 [Caerostris extrusa]|uniref:Pre-C2HC domain-containing protein n=1 Tax=Caerostris extrusa TaxID=172846 RepID=A0AAV4NMB9_CAEEX|nr:hypothetical protein CEXT_275661 [Caerostris extrusa]